MKLKLKDLNGFTIHLYNFLHWIEENTVEKNGKRYMINDTDFYLNPISNDDLIEIYIESENIILK